MATSKNFKKLIIDEIKFAVDKMSESEDPNEVLYYFSAIPGIMHRVFNVEYDPDLVYMHHILRSTQEAFTQRLKASMGGDAVFILDGGQIDKLIELSKILLERLRDNKDIDRTLKKFTVLLYSTTGNGFYLMQKGVLKI
jgi:hypothetical protein